MCNPYVVDGNIHCQIPRQQGCLFLSSPTEVSAVRKCDATGQLPSCVDCRTFVALPTSVAADGHAEASHPLDVFTAELSPVGQRFGDIESRIGGVTH